MRAFNSDLRLVTSRRCPQDIVFSHYVLVYNENPDLYSPKWIILDLARGVAPGSDALWWSSFQDWLQIKQEVPADVIKRSRGQNSTV